MARGEDPRQGKGAHAGHNARGRCAPLGNNDVDFVADSQVQKTRQIKPQDNAVVAGLQIGQLAVSHLFVNIGNVAFSDRINTAQKHPANA